MKVAIPPPLRRIQQAFPPISRFSAPLPAPPAPEPTPIDFTAIVVQLLAIFFLASIFLALSRNLGVAIFIVGIVGLVLRILIGFRNYQWRVKGHRHQVEGYLEALSAYGQAEKIYYESVAQEHAPRQVQQFRQRELSALLVQFPPPAVTEPARAMPPLLAKLAMDDWGKVVFAMPLSVPGLETPYVPHFLYIGKDLPLTIVIDIDRNLSSWELQAIGQYLQQQGWIWIQGNSTECTDRAEMSYGEIDLLLRSLGAK